MLWLVEGASGFMEELSKEKVDMDHLPAENTVKLAFETKISESKPPPDSLAGFFQ